MISKKQEKDEQFSDSLQTVWSEYNIKGKEQLHAIRIEKGKAYITDENIPLLFLIFCHFLLLVLQIQINIVFKETNKLDNNNIRDLEQTMRVTETKMSPNE